MAAVWDHPMVPGGVAQSNSRRMAGALGQVQRGWSTLRLDTDPPGLTSETETHMAEKLLRVELD